VLLGRVRATHAATPLCGSFLFVLATPDAIFLRPCHGVAETLGLNWALRADALGLALAELTLGLALAIRAKEQDEILTPARGSILPAPAGAGKHSGLPTYLRHISITSNECLADRPDGYWVVLSSMER